MQVLSAMESSISNELMEGEQLLWSGSPQSGNKSIVSPGRVFSIIGKVYLGLGLVWLLISFTLNMTLFHPLDFGLLLMLIIIGGTFSILGLVFIGVGSFARFPTTNVFMLLLTSAC